MNKKVTIVAIIFMFFVTTCASFASVVIPINVGNPQEVAQHRHHHRHHGPREDYRRNKRVCPPTCRCIRDGFCRLGECSVKCRCHNCKVVPRHGSHHRPHHHHH